MARTWKATRTRRDGSKQTVRGGEARVRRAAAEMLRYAWEVEITPSDQHGGPREFLRAEHLAQAS